MKEVVLPIVQPVIPGSSVEDVMISTRKDCMIQSYPEPKKSVPHQSRDQGHRYFASEVVSALRQQLGINQIEYLRVD